MFVNPRHTRIAAFVFAVSTPAPVFAYMGPGLGVGALGAALGVVASLLLVLISVVWYPLKRLARRSRARRSGPVAFVPRERGDDGQ
jgi:hypothetical protein